MLGKSLNRDLLSPVETMQQPKYGGAPRQTASLGRMLPQRAAQHLAWIARSTETRRRRGRRTLRPSPRRRPKCFPRGRARRSHRPERFFRLGNYLDAFDPLQRLEHGLTFREAFEVDAECEAPEAASDQASPERR
jgi:hypothetical protein